MTERPQPETMAPLVPEMPRNPIRTDGGRTVETTDRDRAVVDEIGAPLVPDLS
jgi:hypothetical protein